MNAAKATLSPRILSADAILNRRRVVRKFLKIVFISIRIRSEKKRQEAIPSNSPAAFKTHPLSESDAPEAGF